MSYRILASSPGLFPVFNIAFPFLIHNTVEPMISMYLNLPGSHEITTVDFSSLLTYVGEEREPSLSDSEVTLSAMSSEEQGGGGQNGGEASKKSTTSLTQKRRKKRLHSNPKRRSSKSGDGRMSGAPGPSCASERVSQEVALKATQARKLLAKVRGRCV